VKRYVTEVEQANGPVEVVIEAESKEEARLEVLSMCLENGWGFDKLEMEEV